MHINIDESAGAQVTTSGELSYNIAKGQGSELTNMQVYCRVFKLDHSRIYNKESDLSSRINDPDFSPSKK